jgi:pyrophosphatase PpaX
MKKFTCIIFDLDGTLTQTNKLIFATFNHVAQKYIGRTYSPKEITDMFGPPEQIAIERLVGKDKIKEAMNDFYKYYEVHHPQMAHLYDGIKEMLEFLKDHGVILAIFTGKGKRSTLISLDIIGVKDLFDVIISGNDVVNHKPSSEGIRKVIEKFGLASGEVLMVGDSVSDVKAAQEAGVEIAAVLWDSYGKEKVMQMKVDYQFHSVKEFFEWVKSITFSPGVSPA